MKLKKQPFDVSSVGVMAMAAIGAATYLMGCSPKPAEPISDTAHAAPPRETHPVPEQKPDPFAGLVPDHQTRDIFAAIQAKDVESLEFHGGDPIRVTDKALIKRFLVALRQAYGPLPEGGLPSSLFSHRLYVNLKPRKGRERKPLALNFSPHYAAYSYGPDFQKALHLLKGHQHQQAEKVRQLARQVGSKVKAIEIASGAIKTVTAPEEIARLMEALQHLDERAFAYTYDPHPVVITLRLRGGGTRRINVIVPSDAGAVGSEQPPLPEALWKYVGKI